MNNKEVIIEKIIKDALDVSNENVSKAQKEADAILDAAKQTAKEFADEVLPKGDAQAAEIEKRRAMVANLDCKNIILSKKTEIVNSVFDSVANTMRTKDKKAYLDLIKNMIKSSADDNDEVVICEKDKEIITQKEIDSISKAIGKKLTLSKKFGDFDGGVMLCGEKFDKNLTFALEFEQIKDEQEEKLAKILFGE
ncbi:MAG: hypothetical protein K5923_02500 [Clostridia bacterium]|nr:hypothetical protein [Clostridia bacterium]